jgi:hypothetical protein
MTDEDKKLASETVKDDFLPKDYEVPQGPSNYMKFEQGANAFRVLSSAITGYEYWNKENKPIRQKEMWSEKPADIRTDKDGSYRIDHFWAFLVWNYQTNSVQCLEIKQKGIMKAITALTQSKGWGSPKLYDITVTREGEGLDTTYTVMPEPPSEVKAEILEAYSKVKVDLTRLYSGEDPFKI